MISLGFDGSDSRIVEILRAKGGAIAGQLVPTMDALDIKLQRYIQAEELQGQVLHHRTGKLANSIRAIPAHAEGTEIVGAVEGAGGPAWYGRVHEDGGMFLARRVLHHPPHPIRRRDGARVMTGTPYEIRFPKRSFMARGQEVMRSEIERTLQERIETLGGAL